MSSEVGSGQVAIVPTFKGFRKAVTNETDASAKQGAAGFKKAFSRTGTDAGKSTGKGFKAAFDSSAAGTSDKVTAQLQANVAKASRALSAARLKQQDAVGKVTIAEARLAEVQRKYATGSSQVISAVENLNSATRRLNAANEIAEASTGSLKSAQQKLAEAANSGGEGFSRAGRSWATKLRSGFSSVFSGAFLGTIAANAAGFIGEKIRVGIQSAWDLVQTSIGSASDLQQSLGAVDAVFGKYAASVHKQAQQAARDVGLSQNAYNTLGTLLGAQLKNLGTPVDQIAKKTSDLIKLGADLSAQYGGSTADAVDSISSLLRGERDPIEKYGVSFNQARVNAEAFALGLVKVTKDADKARAAQARAEVAQRKYNEAVKKYGKNSTQALSASATLVGAQSTLDKALEGTADQLTNQQQAQATLSLLYKQTADAQGTFSRESDTLAHKQQVQAALWENVQAKIGTAFLPVAAQLSDILAERVIPVISQLVDKYGPGLANAFSKALPSIESFIDQVLPQIPDLLKSFADASPAVLGFLAAVTPLVGGLTQYFGGLFTITKAVLDMMSGTTSPQEFVAKITSIVGPVGVFVQALVNATFGVTDFAYKVGAAAGFMAAAVGRGVNAAVAWVSSLPGRIQAYFAAAGTWLVSSGRALIQGFIDGINQMFAPVGNAVSGILSWVQGFFPHSPAKRGPYSGAGWTQVAQSGRALYEQWTAGFQSTAFVMPSVAQLTAGTVSTSATSTTARSAMAADGDTIIIGGLTTRETAEQLAREIDKKKRRKTRPSRATVGAG